MIADLKNNNEEYKRHKFEVCDQLFSKNRELINHIRTHNKEETYICSYCNKVFAKKQYIRIHIIRMHINKGVKSYQCDLCKKAFTLKRYFNLHIKTHTSERPHQCKLCKKTFIHHSYLTNHLRKKIPHSKCDICNEIFAYKYMLKMHMYIHTREVSHFVSDAGNNHDNGQNGLITENGQGTTSDNEDSTDNIKLSPLAIIDLCSDTSDNSSTGSKLDNHIRTHTKETYICSYCNKAFAKKQYIQIHIIRMHMNEGVKSYQCNLCKKAFRSKQNLNRHIKTHTSERPHQCKICKKTFNQQRYLTSHLLKKRPCYKCDICNILFASKFMLNMHMIIHSKEVSHFVFDVSNNHDNGQNGLITENGQGTTCDNEDSTDNINSPPLAIIDLCSDTSDNSSTGSDFEHWCGKGTNPTAMQASSESEQILNQSTCSKYDMLLINGNIMKTPIKVNNKRYRILNTCAFDSITALVTMAITDSEHYKKFIITTTNELLVFCNNLAKYGTNTIIYERRLVILKNIFMKQVKETNITLIDAKCNVTFIVESLLMNVPSATQFNMCTTCGKKSQNSLATIIVRLSKKFLNLEADLEKYAKGNLFRCSDCRVGLVQYTRKLHEHIFIETESYNERALLTDFPFEISVEDKSYRLYGAVVYVPGHYIACVRRIGGLWEIHNDLMKKYTMCHNPSSIQINPHLLMYALQ